MPIPMQLAANKSIPMTVCGVAVFFFFWAQEMVKVLVEIWVDDVCKMKELTIWTLLETNNMCRVAEHADLHFKLWGKIQFC
jgi:hypothetical protein